ncbi:MAG: glycosyltransferase family 2 protein [Deltaproteobacteria bacterium]|nr:glycosyltransferase family 2 protein [Deltaproteobacteria bacterium]MBW2417262.1 glycosyltransferase family 2 protein [Deltaproteobacteria bacterium]
MDLSVVVVNWNTRELLLRCLSALERELACLAEAGRLSSEILVVDNGSGDGSADAVAERCPGARLIRLPENRGYAAGNNAALPLVRGRIVLLLNSDALVTPGALAACVEVLDATSGAGAAGPQLLHPNGHLQNSIHAFPSLWTELLPTLLLELLLPKRFPSKRHFHQGPIDVDAVLGAALFVSREAFEAVGPMPAEYFFFLEETEWCWRIRRAGFRVLHVPGARIVHLSGASSKRKDPARTRIEFHRSLYHFLRVHRGPAVVAAAAGARVARGFLSLLLGCLLLPFSPRQRRRTRERWQLLRWHLWGCPAGWGLAPADWSPAPAPAASGPQGLDADPRTGKAQRSNLPGGGVE